MSLIFFVLPTGMAPVALKSMLLVVPLTPPLPMLFFTVVVEFRNPICFFSFSVSFAAKIVGFFLFFVLLSLDLRLLTE